MDIKIGERTIYYQVQYTRASKFQLDLTPEGLVTVKAPKGSGPQEINSFLRKNSKSITRLYDYLDNRQFISSKKEYDEEENYLYLGRACKMHELPGFEVDDDVDQSELPNLLKKYYTDQTKKLIKKRVRHYEKIIGVSAKSITIVDSVKTWGTCNSARELTFNYRLSMAPPASLDYVVIHELCHIHHMNHDRSFWREVGSIDRDYKAHSAFFDRYGGVMTT